MISILSLSVIVVQLVNVFMAVSVHVSSARCLPVLQQVVITMHSDDLESLTKHEDNFFDQFNAVSPVGTVAPAQLGEEQANDEEDMSTTGPQVGS
jgi:hypothetical protein